MPVRIGVDGSVEAVGTPVADQESPPIDAELVVIEDGFGGEWERCELGDRCGLQVVRPGKVQCYCDGVEMERADVATLADVLGLPDEKVAFIVLQAERRIREGELRG